MHFSDRGTHAGHRLLSPLVLTFCAAEATLGILLQILHGDAVIWTSFGAVVLACLFCTRSFQKTAVYALTQLALVCTVCADFFLLVHPEQPQFTAMLFFSVTQLSYFARIYLEDTSKKRRLVHAVLRLALPLLALLLTLLVLGGGADRVALISMFYFANLLLNVVFAFLVGKRPTPLAIGLTLFALCDVFVGLSLLDGYLPVAEGSLLDHLAHPGFNLAWVFYVPAQTLLALSLHKKTDRV